MLNNDNENKMTTWKNNKTGYDGDYVERVRDEFPWDFAARLEIIRRDIGKALAGCEKFDGILFCDVSGGGINIQLLHKDTPGYSVGEQVQINYDFSNWVSIVGDAVAAWNDTDEINKSIGMASYYKRFGTALD